jgi:hypothetical protein
MDIDLQRLLDERAIERRLVDYCRGVDRGDAALVASIYHPDGTDDHGSFKGLGVDFANYVTGRLAERYEATMHSISNVAISFTGPDSARVECHVCARHLGNDDRGPALMTFGGRYIDRFERRGGEWKIAHRAVVHEWDKVEHVELAFPPGRFTEGVRGRSDPAYPPD